MGVPGARGASKFAWTTAPSSIFAIEAGGSKRRAVTETGTSKENVTRSGLAAAQPKRWVPGPVNQNPFYRRFGGASAGKITQSIHGTKVAVKYFLSFIATSAIYTGKTFKML